MRRIYIYIRYIFLSLLLSLVVGTAMAERVVVTSGRVVYDAFGRVMKVYHPTVDRRAGVTVYSDTVDTEPPTVTEYDVLDRPVKVTYPDGGVTETDYSVSGSVQVVTVTDAMGNVSRTHVDGSGRTVKSTSKEPSLFSFAVSTAKTSLPTIRTAASYIKRTVPIFILNLDRCTRLKYGFHYVTDTEEWVGLDDAIIIKRNETHPLTLNNTH